MRTHLIVGNSEDYHAVAVAWGLMQSGHDALIWDGIGPSIEGRVSIVPGAQAASRFRLEDREIENLGSVWFRRAVKHRGLDHLAKHARDFAEIEHRETHRCLCAAAEKASKFVIGGEGVSISSIKSYQLDLASEQGFAVPATLITNDPMTAKQFVRHHGKVVIKPFAPHFWHKQAESSFRVAATNVLTADSEIDDDSVASCPTIFQAFVDKEYELRVTVVGNRVFCAKISDLADSGFVDWRFNLTMARFEEFELPQAVRSALIKYVSRLGLKYGCIDLIQGKDGALYFLEINPSGQFLFVEQFAPEIKLFSAFISMMMAGDVDYSINVHSNVSMAKFEQSDEYTRMVSSAGKVVTDQPKLSTFIPG